MAGESQNWGPKRALLRATKLSRHRTSHSPQAWAHRACSSDAEADHETAVQDTSLR